MSQDLLPILKNHAVLERTSPATRRVLEERAKPVAGAPLFFTAELYAVLRQVVDEVLPQGAIGTDVDIAAAIDTRLADGKGSGWRFADLPADGEAYTRGLTVLATMLPVRKEDLRSIANGDVDGQAGFAMSKWLLVLKTDAVKAWLSHPAVMERMEYYGFADGASGLTDGPTAVEGWQAITPDTALSFESDGAA